MKLPIKKSSRPKCVLYVDKTSLSFFLKNGQKPIVLNLGPELIKDMEIVAPEQYIQALVFWMDNNKIPPCDVIIIVSENVYFEHALQSLAGEEESDKEIETYLSTIPFEQMVCRTLIDDASKRVVVLGRDYYDLLLDFLEKRYIRVLALFPASLLQIKSPEDVKVDSLVKNLDDFKKFNFLSDFERKYIPESFITRNGPKDTKNLKIMVGVFVGLLAILGAVIYFSLIRKG